MTNAFEKHGIRHISPSSLVLWKNDPCLWAGKYLRKWKDEAGPNAWLGNAVESGLSAWLYKRDMKGALDAATQEWSNKCQGEVSDEITVAATRLPAMLAMAVQGAGDRGIPTSTQAKVECWLDGIGVPCNGFSDFEWTDEIIDLKTTKAMPSSPREDHVAQMAIYWQGRQRKKVARLLYCTEKRTETYTIGDNELATALADMTVTARTLARFLDRVHDGRDALAMLPASTDGFRWNDNLRNLLAEERRAA